MPRLPAVIPWAPTFEAVVKVELGGVRGEATTGPAPVNTSPREDADDDAPPQVDFGAVATGIPADFGAVDTGIPDANAKSKSAKSVTPGSTAGEILFGARVCGGCLPVFLTRVAGRPSKPAPALEVAERP